MAQNLELVEKLVEKTGISYGEAKATLERTDWDILEAMIQLENQGKVQYGKTAQYSTNNESGTYQQNDSQNQQCKQGKEKKNKDDCAGENFKKSAKSFGNWLKNVFDKGNRNSIQMFKGSEKKIEMPVTAFILLLIFCFWIILPLMIVALFFGCRFAFAGDELGKDSVNSAMGKATDIADSIKNDFKAEN